MNDIYEKLRECLHDNTPMGYPDTDEGFALLRYLFTEEAAEVAVHMTLDLETADAIAGRCEKDASEVSSLLEKMYTEGLVRKHSDENGNTYSAFPFVPGILENILFTRCGALGVGEMDVKLVELITASFSQNIHEMVNNEPGFMRTLPVESTVPSETSTVLPFQQASDVIEKAPEPIVVFPCHDRVLKEDACDRPLEVCMAFGDHARYYLDDGVAGRRIDRKEAMEILKLCEDNAMVHQVVNMTDESEVSWLCNCCGCCCANISTSNKLFPDGKVKNVEPSPYIAQIESEICSGCGTCVDRCQTNAIEMDDDVAVLKPIRCIGCGLCVETCPTGAIQLVLRDEAPDYPVNMAELNQRQQNKERF